MTVTTCAMGELLTEFLPRNPYQKFTQPGELIGPFPSGAPAIFTAQVTGLSYRVIFLGCVGNDDFDRLIIERLRHGGVITGEVHVMNSVVTGAAFMSHQNPQQRDLVFNIPNNACGLFIAEYINKDLPKQCNHPHIVGSSLFPFCMIGAIRKAVTVIKSAGDIVSFDPDIRKEMLSIPEMTQTLDYLIKYMGIFIPSENELPFFAHHENLSEKQVVSDLLHGGVRHVTIKRAQHGTSYYELKNGTLYAQHVAGHNIEITDPTSVGDCSDTTLITLFLSGFPAHKMLQYANVGGVLAVIQQGPMERISSLADIEDSLQQH